MKNKKLIKTLAIIFAVVIVLSWIIPGTTYNDAGTLELGGVNPTGILSIFGSFDIVTMYFLQNSILVLLVGALYGVMNKTGAYKELVDSISSKLEGNILIILSVILFIIVPALTNIYFPLFVLVPLFISLLLKAGYSKNTALLSTVGAILIGTSCNMSSAIFAQITSSTANTYITIKLAFLAVSTVVTVLYAIKKSKDKEKTSKKEEDDESLLIVPEKKSTQKNKISATPLFVFISIMLVLMILGLTKWNTEFFTNINNAVMGVSIGKFPIFKNILGAFGEFGNWYNGEIYALLIITTLVIGLVYKLKIWDILDGMVEGGKKFVSIAILVALINLLTIFTLNSGFLATIIQFLVKSGNIAIVTITSIFSAPFVVDQSYVAQYNLGMILGKLTSANKDLIALVSQLTFGITMLVAPTSTILIAGMAYLEKDYTSWFKYIWKLAVILIIAIFIAVTVASLIK